MSKFLSGDRKQTLNIAKISGHNALNDPLSKTNGFIVNQLANKDSALKERFQFAHSHFLS